MVFDVTATTKIIVRQCIFPYYTFTFTQAHTHTQTQHYVMQAAGNKHSIFMYAFGMIRVDLYVLVMLLYLCASFVCIFFCFVDFPFRFYTNPERERRKKWMKMKFFFHFCLVAIAWFGIHCDYMHFVYW